MNFVDTESRRIVDLEKFWLEKNQKICWFSMSSFDLRCNLNMFWHIQKLLFFQNSRHIKNNKDFIYELFFLNSDWNSWFWHNFSNICHLSSVLGQFRKFHFRRINAQSSPLVEVLWYEHMMHTNVFAIFFYHIQFYIEFFFENHE